MGNACNKAEAEKPEKPSKPMKKPPPSGPDDDEVSYDTNTSFTDSEVSLHPSKESDESVEFKTINDSKFDVRLDWVNFEGKLKYYMDIAAGETQTQQTYVGHNWLYTVSSEGLKGDFEIEGQQGMLRIHDDDGELCFEGPQYDSW